MEDHPPLRISLDGNQLEMTRHNSGLWLFVGETAVYNHIFVHDHESERVGYLFKGMDRFKEYAHFMIRHQFPLHKNLQETDLVDMDLRAYEAIRHEVEPKRLVQGIKIIPSGWEQIIGHEQGDPQD